MYNTSIIVMLILNNHCIQDLILACTVLLSLPNLFKISIILRTLTITYHVHVLYNVLY